MHSISGELEAGEAQDTVRAIAARRRGSLLAFYAAQIFLIIGGGVAGQMLGWGFREVFKGQVLGEMDPSLPPIAGLVVGYLAYLRICRPMLLRNFRRKMVERGLPTRFAYALTFDDDLLTLVAGPVVTTADWTAVTEVFKAKDYWVFMVQTDPWFAPTRFFSSAADEKAFVASAFAHLGEGAQNRSKAAAEFASS